jgi:archaellum component FlaC
MKNKKEQIEKLKFTLGCINKQLKGVKKEYTLIKRELTKLNRVEGNLWDKHYNICEKIAKLKEEA